MSVVSLIIAAVPLNWLRILLLRALKGYSIGRNCVISFGTYIAVEKFSLGDNSFIDSFNVFKGPSRIIIGRNAYFGKFNRVNCQNSFRQPEHAQNKQYRRELNVGDYVYVGGSHVLDVSGYIHMGDGSWLAGTGSQLYTHGMSARVMEVYIGSDTYVGSACRFAPGSRVGNKNIVGLGSVVTRDFSGVDYSVIAGNPASVIRSRDGDVEKGIPQFWRQPEV